jgi:hypothetical protein
MRQLIPALVLVVSAGCTARPPEPVYEANGFCFVPPAGWSERARHDDARAGSTQDRLLVQYKRLTAGRPAWLRVSVADVSAAVPLTDCLFNQPLVKGWRASGRVQTFGLNGLHAARLLIAGKLQQRDYEGEIIAARQGELVYFFTATFPANDESAREQVRQAVATASWRAGTEVAAR